MTVPAGRPGTRRHFVIVGAQRCGTSYLYERFDRHPDIEMARPRKPEPKFFLDPDRVARGVTAYEELFGHRLDAWVRGEKATSYIESRDAIERLVRILPEVRIVVIVRDPIARAISNYRFSVENGLEHLRLEEALTTDAEHRPYDPQLSVSPYAYLSRSLYIDQIERNLRPVKPDRVQVVVLEEMLADDAIFDRLCSFVGVEPHDPKPDRRPVNATSVEVDALSREHEEVLRDFFEPSVRRLETFLGRPITAWPNFCGSVLTSNEKDPV